MLLYHRAWIITSLEVSLEQGSGMGCSVPLWRFLDCGVGAVTAIGRCQHQLGAPASSGGLGGAERTLLGMNYCSSGIGTQSKLQHHSLEHCTLVQPCWLRVFGQEHMCRPGTYLLTLLGFSCLVRLCWSFFSADQALDFAQRVPQAPVSLGHRGCEIFCCC